MPTNTLHIIAAAAVLVILTFVVGAALLTTRVREMRAKRVHPQAVSTASKMAARLENVQAADNFRNLFETPVLFYAQVAIAVGLGHIPSWLVLSAWVYVGLRIVHSVIHCTYNNVMHRLVAFLLGFVLLVVTWIGYVFEIVARSAA
jgi:hypothetical protein